MEIEQIMETLAETFEDDEEMPKGTVIGMLEDQIVLSGGGADTRAFVQPDEAGGLRIEVHAAVEIDGDVDDDQLLKEATDAMNEEVWPPLAERGYEPDEEDWNPELGVFTRFGVKIVTDTPALIEELRYLAGADLHEAFMAE